MDKFMKILIVDDDVGMTETIKDILEEIGYDIKVANDGYEALNIVENEELDLILMDIKMPGINGVETFKKLKKINQNISVIMMTAYSVQNLISEALNEGALAVINKPLNMINLLEMVNNFALSNKSILIIDDDKSICEYLVEILTSNNFLVECVYTGENAIELIKRKNYEIILLDYILPDTNGISILKLIKEIRPNSKIIMITGFKQDLEINCEKDEIKDDFKCLYKPFETQELIDLIEKINKSKILE